MNVETIRSSLSIAAACELAAILGVVFGIFELFSYWPLGLTIIILAMAATVSAFWIRRSAAVDEENQEKHAVDGSALVDDFVIAALTSAEMPLHIVRAVRRVKSQKSLPDFRTMIEKECQGDITGEQLETVLRLVRVPQGSLPPPAPSPVV